MAKPKYRIRVGISMGDPSGIGPEILAKALDKLRGLADFVVIGDGGVINKLKNKTRNSQKFILIDLKNVEIKKFKFGKISPEYGKAAYEYLKKAADLLKYKQIDCLVTCPVSKEAINLSGIKNFYGQTEFLAKSFKVKDAVMMLLNDRLKFSLLTRHTPLAQVPRQLKRRRIAKTIEITYASLEKLFSIKNPRLVVCGLNPHASDNGLIGNEENRIIKPELENLKKKYKFLYGPLSSDVAILKAYQKQFDCVIAMYHDQALIPLKLSSQYTGINITLGLPFVRTSPLHGTAFDLAGRNCADPRGLIEAIKLACRCTSSLKKN